MQQEALGGQQARKPPFWTIQGINKKLIHVVYLGILESKFGRNLERNIICELN